MFAYKRTIIRRRVLLSLTTGKTLGGVIWAKRGPLVVLRDATLHEAGQLVPLDGEVVIERPKIEMIQVLPSEEP